MASVQVGDTTVHFVLYEGNLLRRLFKSKIFAIMIMVIGLVACVRNVPNERVPLNQAMTWEERQAQLQKVKTWQLQGVMAYRTLATDTNGIPANAGNVSFTWNQRANSDYDMHFYGAFGLGHTALRGNPKMVYLTLPNGSSYFAMNPEQLLKSHANLNLPVSSLHYWIRGLPEPMAASWMRFDRYKHLAELKQEDWVVTFSEYTAVNGQDLPGILVLTHPNYYVKIVIRNWQR